MRLEGQVAIIVGAGSSRSGRRDDQALGNGAAAAQLFAREGARLLLVDRDADALAETCRSAAAESAEVYPCLADIAVGRDIERIAATALQQFGRIDILLNNVGLAAPGGLFDTTPEIWERCFAINVRSVFLMARAVIPAMRQQRHGRIVNVASIAALRSTLPPPYAYAASKAALIALSRSLALEFAAEGIRSNCIVPGMIDTPMVRASVLAAGMNEVQAEAYDAQRHRASPTGQQGSPWDIAQAALFLASGEADYINGTELVIDGGLTQRLSFP
jgi:NAD(P)-dependent dehydrogenase (short-subunit alcohol dehydrogenase family)